jgi:hypothetical protein
MPDDRRLWWWDRGNNIIYAAWIWAILAMLVFLSFGGNITGEDRPFWYRCLTGYFIQNTSQLVSALFCLRNGFGRQMPSGRLVWQMFGIAQLCYLLGNIFFTSWELVWHLPSTGSLGDPFFVTSSTLTILTLALALITQKVRLRWSELAVVCVLGAYASLFLLWGMPAMETNTAPVAIESIASTKEVAPATSPAAEPENAIAPDWVQEIDKALKPYGDACNLYYVWCDVIALMMAMTVLFGYWGGRSGVAWKIIPQSVFCFYLADMWYAYAGRIEGYQAGFFLEVFWSLGAVLFAVAAALEYKQTLIDRQKFQEQYEQSYLESME